MLSNYPQGIAFVFTQEGGYSNDPKDPGGPTNFGITLVDARKHWKADATAEDVRGMPRSVAEDIYRTDYANPVCFDSIVSGLDIFTLDSSVNSGVGRANLWLAKAIGSTHKDYPSLASQSHQVTDVPSAIKAGCATRLSFLQSLRTWSHFGAGWGHRVSSLRALCLRVYLQSTQKSTSEVKTELGKEVTQSKSKASTGITTTATTSAAAPPTVYHFWHWDILHVAIALVAIAAGVFLVRTVVRNIHDASALEAEIKTLENLG